MADRALAYDAALREAVYSLTYRLPDGVVHSGVLLMQPNQLRPTLRALWDKGVTLVLVRPLVPKDST